MKSDVVIIDVEYREVGVIPWKDIAMCIEHMFAVFGFLGMLGIIL